MNWQEIEAAAKRLQGVANATPVMTSRTLDERTGNSVRVKCESLQRGGAFKFRGAYNALSQLGPAERQAGAITYSSGNHAQATALAGRLLGIKVVVVMPEDAPRVKRQATEGYGAEVVTYKPGAEQREEVAARIQAERGLTLVPPFNHPQVIAGQGTAAKELIENQGKLDVVLAPCGGGGLLSGTALAVKHLLPKARVIGVEPEGANNGQRAFRAGRIERVEYPRTMADGLKPQALGDLTFAVIREYVDDMVTVSEEEIRSTLEFVWTRMKLVVEPSGVVGLAPVFHRKLGLQGQRVGVIFSGGNADIGAVADWLRASNA
ncbi:MAG TPA: threo-3-hydroxy-L-aspartate ammonia-lyase [bacterium]|nr:threo-3-hydroxy-L-aspartate ammonia-lyase [bacterium]